MQGKQEQRRRDTERVVESGLARLSSERALPAWESFPERDRHRLVQGLLQAARRQVERPWPMDGLLRK
jgi:hypothetical protein